MKNYRELLEDARNRGEKFNKGTKVVPFERGESIHCGNLESLQNEIWTVFNIVENSIYYTGWKVTVKYKDTLIDLDSSWCWKLWTEHC